MVGTLGPGITVGKAARFRYVATAGQTTFSGADASAQALTLVYTPGFVEVAVDGIWLSPDEYTATNGSSIVFSPGLAVGRVVYVYSLYAATVANTYDKTQNGADITAPNTFRNNIAAGPNDLSNVSFSVSASAGALTIALKDITGADPTALNPIILEFRNATLINGNPQVQRTVTGANSVVVPSTSTCGSVNAKAFRLWIIGWDDAGTFRLGVFNASDASGIYPLDEAGIASSLQVVAAGNAAGQHYTAGAAVTSKAFRILGYVDWNASGVATAGTWTTTNLNSIVTFGQGVRKPGDRVQQQASYDAQAASGTTLLPFDDTIPQNTEGTQFLSKAITPSNAANRLVITTFASYFFSVSSTVGQAIFQDSIANALAASANFTWAAGGLTQLLTTFEMTAQTTSSTTFKMRAGGHVAGTIAINSSAAAARLYGGSMCSFLKIEELMG